MSGQIPEPAVEAAIVALHNGNEDWAKHNPDPEAARAQMRDALTAAKPLLGEKQIRADELRAAAEDWLHRDWTKTPRKPARAVERVAAAQYVGDWLNERAKALAPAQVVPQPAQEATS